MMDVSTSSKTSPPGSAASSMMMDPPLLVTPNISLSVSGSLPPTVEGAAAGGDGVGRNGSHLGDRGSTSSASITESSMNGSFVGDNSFTTNAGGAPGSGKLDIVAFCATVGRLKHLKRTGWVNKEVPEPETVAGHMYRMGILAFLLDSTRVNVGHCIKMCLVHDLAEAIVGDITPHCGVTLEDKYQREKSAMDKIAGMVPAEVGAQFVALWEEYEAGITPESMAVKDLDKFDMIAQALEYEQTMNKPGHLEDFFTSTQNVFTTPDVQPWADTIRLSRDLWETTEKDLLRVDTQSDISQAASKQTKQGSVADLL